MDNYNKPRRPDYKSLRDMVEPSRMSAEECREFMQAMRQWGFEIEGARHLEQLNLKKVKADVAAAPTGNDGCGERILERELSFHPSRERIRRRERERDYSYDLGR